MRVKERTDDQGLTAYEMHVAEQNLLDAAIECADNPTPGNIEALQEARRALSGAYAHFEYARQVMEGNDAV